MNISMLCLLLYAAYPIFSLDLCPRFSTWLGKNKGIKKWMALKNRRRICSRFATNLGNQEWVRSSERERKIHWKLLIWTKETETTRAHVPDPHGSTRYGPTCYSPRSTCMTKHGLVLCHAVPFYQPHMTRPHIMRPHLSARNSQLNRIPPIWAPCEGFRQGLGENWGKTKKLGKTEYN
jgi:hypothetical protein